MTDASEGALAGITVLDLSRILAGPTCTQLLGDLGAEVIKIENPATGGDDTRQWGPVYAMGPDGERTDLSTYFMCANRNKYSVAVDIATEAGRDAIRALAQGADVMVENFKSGGLKRHGLDPETLRGLNPRLVTCSITGFGQTGPNAAKPGYDLLAQAYGGIMSITGEPDGAPMKVGVGIADVMCGMYAATGILAALRHRDRTGEAQHIDIGLVDAQMAWLINAGTQYLASEKTPGRRGNAHPSIVPYELFQAADGPVILAVGNDGQFARLCGVLGHDWHADARYATNPARLEHRDALVPLIAQAVAAWARDDLIARLEAVNVPAGPVNDIAQALGSDQAIAREAVVEMSTDATEDGRVRLLGNPLKMSATPVSYRRAPPRFGADTEAVLRGILPRITHT